MAVCKPHSVHSQSNFLPWDATGLRVAVLASKAKLNTAEEQQTRLLQVNKRNCPTWEADAGCSQHSWLRETSYSREMPDQKWSAGTGWHLQHTDTISHMDISPRSHQAGGSHVRPRQFYADHALSPRWVSGTAKWLQPSDPIGHTLNASPAAISLVETVPAPPRWPDRSPHPPCAVGTAKWLWLADSLSRSPNSRARRRNETPRVAHSATRPMAQKRQVDSHGKCSSRSHTHHTDRSTSERRTRSCCSSSTNASFASGDANKTFRQLTPSLISRSRAQAPPSWNHHKQHRGQRPCELSRHRGNLQARLP